MKAHVLRYLTVFEVQIHLLSTQKHQKALKVTPVIDSYHGFCSAAEFLRESGEKVSVVTRREVLGREGSQELPAQPWGGPTCKYALQSQGSKYRRLVSTPEEGQILGDAAFYIFSLSLA